MVILRERFLLAQNGFVAGLNLRCTNVDALVPARPTPAPETGSKNAHSLLRRAQYKVGSVDTMRAMRIPLGLKVVWTVWVMVWAPVYWREYGAQNFLFFCDLGNLFIVAALWFESPLLFSWQATGLLLFQSLFTLDLVVAVVSGRHPIGGTEYMFDPHIALWVRLLSLFHVVTPPLLLWAIRRLGYDGRGWKYQTLSAWIVVPINYFWRPQYDVNWARGPFFREQHAVPGLLYLLGYLIVVPAVVYFPTHRFLVWIMQGWRAKS